MSKEVPATLSDVVLQLKINNRLLIAQIKASDAVSRHDLVVLLSSTGASYRDIAELLDTTPKAVEGVLSRARSKDKKPEDAASKDNT